ncbi:MAG: ATP-binding protein [Bacteroidales bacterium]
MEKKTNRHTNLCFNALIYILCAMAFYGCSKEGSKALTPEELSVDSAMLEIVLRTILTNAIKFSKRGGGIRVLAEKENAAGQKYWRISVADHGIGMSQETLDGLFSMEGSGSTFSFTKKAA